MREGKRSRNRSGGHACACAGMACQSVDAQDNFHAFWADGHGREPSASSLCFGTKAGDVYRLPGRMMEEFAAPERMD